MTRADLTEQLYQAIGMPLKESDVVVCAIFDSIVRALRSGDKVEIRGFGSFHTRQRRGRIGRNPKTGAKVVSFRQGCVDSPSWQLIRAFRQCFRLLFVSCKDRETTKECT
jgi:integration host factor subunit beta